MGGGPSATAGGFPRRCRNESTLWLDTSSWHAGSTHRLDAPFCHAGVQRCCATRESEDATANSCRGQRRFDIKPLPQCAGCGRAELREGLHSTSSNHAAEAPCVPVSSEGVVSDAPTQARQRQVVSINEPYRGKQMEQDMKSCNHLVQT